VDVVGAIVRLDPAPFVDAGTTGRRLKGTEPASPSDSDAPVATPVTEMAMTATTNTTMAAIRD